MEIFEAQIQKDEAGRPFLKSRSMQRNGFVNRRHDSCQWYDQWRQVSQQITIPRRWKISDVISEVEGG